MSVHRYTFTHNGYAEADLAHYQALVENEEAKYIILGRERAPTTGARHLQGFLSWTNKKRFQATKLLLPPGVHIETTRGKGRTIENLMDLTHFIVSIHGEERHLL